MARSKDAVDNVRSDRGARTENRSIAHFLSKLLPVCFEFGWYSRVLLLLLAWHGLLRRAGLGDIERHVPVVCWLWRVDDRFLFDYADISTRENTFLSGSFVPTTPPVIVHVFKNLKAIVRVQCQVTSIRWSIRVQSRCNSQNGWYSRVGRRGCWARVLCRFWLFLVQTNAGDLARGRGERCFCYGSCGGR